jgi:hypothetical protein
MKIISNILFALLFLSMIYSCSDNSTNPVSENQKMGIDFKGKESELNGSYKATFSYYDSSFGMTFTEQQFFSLQDGKVIESKFGSPDVMWFYSSGSGGYIGYYSFDGTNFKAAMNCSAPGAPITVVTDKVTGTVDNSTISAVWYYNAGSKSEVTHDMKLVKYTSSIDHYHE